MIDSKSISKFIFLELYKLYSKIFRGCKICGKLAKTSKRNFQGLNSKDYIQVLQLTFLLTSLLHLLVDSLLMCSWLCHEYLFELASYI